MKELSSKLNSKVDLVKKMSIISFRYWWEKIKSSSYIISSKLCGYSKGGRDINLAACVELIHAATLMHDDVIDNALVRRGSKKTINTIWGNKSSILVGDYLLSRCFEMMVEDG